MWGRVFYVRWDRMFASDRCLNAKRDLYQKTLEQQIHDTKLPTPRYRRPIPVFIGNGAWGNLYAAEEGAVLNRPGLFIFNLNGRRIGLVAYPTKFCA